MKKMLHKRGQRQRGVKQTLNVAPIDIILFLHHHNEDGGRNRPSHVQIQQ